MKYLIALALLASTAAHAQQTYEDRAAWETAASGTSTTYTFVGLEHNQPVGLYQGLVFEASDDGDTDGEDSDCQDGYSENPESPECANGYDDDGDANAFEFTLTGNYAIGDLMIIPEFGVDTTSEYTFLDNDFELTGSFTSFLIAAVYKF